MPPSTGHLTSAPRSPFLDVTALRGRDEGQGPTQASPAVRHAVPEAGRRQRAGKGRGAGMQGRGEPAGPAAGQLPSPPAEMLQHRARLAQHASGAELPVSHSSAPLAARFPPLPTGLSIIFIIIPLSFLCGFFFFPPPPFLTHWLFHR